MQEWDTFGINADGKCLNLLTYRMHMLMNCVTGLVRKTRIDGKSKCLHEYVYILSVGTFVIYVCLYSIYGCG